tara:strand:- start:465 stop:647 length:183 start_codon:yes stop_codon:yes gene_type:complete
LPIAPDIIARLHKLLRIFLHPFDTCVANHVGLPGQKENLQRLQLRNRLGAKPGKKSYDDE